MTSFRSENWLKDYDALLAPFAVKHSLGLGRKEFEPADPFRSRFTVDDGRVRFSKAFNALNGKTQVFTSHTHEHVRTRLTHSYQVASLSESIARYIGLNEDLAHTIGLTHDIGHAPFGHAGQDQLHECLAAFGYSFEHNVQSHRIVTVLEPKNLNIEVLHGLLKHTKVDVMNIDSTAPVLPCGHSLEAQAVNIIDRITYTGHDCQDGLQANILHSEDIKETTLGLLAFAHPKGLIRGILQILIDDLIAESAKNIERYSIHTLQDVYAIKETVLRHSPEVERMLTEFNKFLFNSFYNHPIVHAQNNLGKAIIATLFTKLLKKPTAEITTLEEKFMYSRYEAIRDFISSLTDREAKQLVEILP